MSASEAVGSAAARRAVRGGVAPQPRGFRDGHPFYRLSQRAVAVVLRSLASVHVEGMERCPPSGSGPLLLATNHLAMVDIPLLAAWCPRPVMWLAKMEVLHIPMIGGIGAFYGAVYLRRGESDRQAIRETLGSLAAGQVVGVFPEGHRARDGVLQRGQPGVALLAQRSGAQVWPVAVTGTNLVGRRARPQVTLRSGAPFDAIAVARERFGPSATHQQVTDAIMERIAALLPEERRGPYR